MKLAQGGCLPGMKLAEGVCLPGMKLAQGGCLPDMKLAQGGSLTCMKLAQLLEYYYSKASNFAIVYLTIKVSGKKKFAVTCT